MIIIYMILMCIFTSTGQVLVKKGINRGRKFYNEPLIFIGGLLIVVSPILYLQVIRVIGLSNAYGLNGLSYLIIYIMSIFFLKEKGSFFQSIGLIFITGGVLIWSI